MSKAGVKILYKRNNVFIQQPVCAPPKSRWLTPDERIRLDEVMSKYQIGLVQDGMKLRCKANKNAIRKLSKRKQKKSTTYRALLKDSCQS